MSIIEFQKLHFMLTDRAFQRIIAKRKKNRCETLVNTMFFFGNGSAKLFINIPVSRINTAVADHFEMFFRDMPDKALNKFHDRNGFFHIIHLLYGVGTSFMIWSAYLKLTRKMGNADEQGRMFSTSEFVRGVFGMLIGFAGVAFLGKAMLSPGEMDTQALGTCWRNLLFLSGTMFLVFSLLVFIFVPSNVVGAEETDDQPQESFSMKNIVKVLKMPGTWMLSALIFCCFSFTSAGNGYLGAYTVNVLGVSQTTASTYAIIRNYIIAAIMTFAIGFVSDKIGSKAKTLGIYLAIASVLCVALIFTKSTFVLCIAISFAFSIVYTGMRGIYFATLNEVGIPLAMNGIATGIISMLCYLPDVYFAKLAGTWLDKYGNQGYDFIWYWAIGCGILGIIVACITYRYSQKLERQQMKN